MVEAASETRYGLPGALYPWIYTLEDAKRHPASYKAMKCRGCGFTFFLRVRVRREYHSCSPSCTMKARGYQPRPAMIRCEKCRRMFPNTDHGKNRVKCDACKLRDKRERQNARRRAGTYPIERPATVNCETCGAVVPVNRIGPVKRFCEPCLLARKAAALRRRRSAAWIP